MAGGRDTNFLIVDDQETMRRLIKSCLRQLDFMNFKDAENVDQGLSILDQEPIDVIVLDWNMPNKPGIELVKSVRSNDKHKSIPIIMVTSVAQQESVMEAIKAGVNSYIVKPVNTKTLGEKLEAIFAK